MKAGLGLMFMKKVKGIFGGNKGATMAAGGFLGSLSLVAKRMFNKKALDDGTLIKPQRVALGSAFMKNSFSR